MRDGAGRAHPTRVVALVSPQGHPRASSDLKQCFALLVGSMSVLGAIVAFLVVSPGVAISASNLAAARWLLALLGVVTGALAFATARLFRRRSTDLAPRRLTLDKSGVQFDDLGQPPTSSSPHEALVDFSQPFGMTLLGNRARDRIVLAVTTPQRSVYFGARLDSDERRVHAKLISKASTVSDDDAVLDATGPDGAPLEVRIRDLQDLASNLLRADRQAYDRCFLSDTHGVPVVLDGPLLRIGKIGFDLRAPLEWRATLFQEPFAALMPLSDLDFTLSPSAGVMVYQATWVRQGGSEAVLVSLLASLSSISLPDGAALGDVPEVTSAILRDLRLLQATPEEPPPFELRVGIERMYMLRLRAALDRAPRASRKSIPSSATR